MVKRGKVLPQIHRIDQSFVAEIIGNTIHFAQIPQLIQLILTFWEINSRNPKYRLNSEINSIKFNIPSSLHINRIHNGQRIGIIKDFNKLICISLKVILFCKLNKNFQMD